MVNVIYDSVKLFFSQLDGWKQYDVILLCFTLSFFLWICSLNVLTCHLRQQKSKFLKLASFSALATPPD